MRWHFLSARKFQRSAPPPWVSSAAAFGALNSEPFLPPHHRHHQHRLLLLSFLMEHEEYEVFLSCRGNDTRKGLTGHLYQALRDKGIRAFIDDEELQRGEMIGDTLSRAINRSAMGIVILSEHYADSRWCLTELTKIIESGKKILPIFHHVDPSDVRKQKGPFEASFCNHERRFGEKNVSKWRQAFAHVGILSGFVLDGQFNGNEAQLVQAVVNHILSEFNIKSFNVAKYPVGIDSRAKDVRTLLCLEDTDVRAQEVRVVGICGMAGVGKTTLARSIYNEILTKFHATAFIGNISVQGNQQDGLIKLQKQFISEVLRYKNPEIYNVWQGAAIIRNRFSQKKVLVVLDDVDHVSQLEALAGGYDWFGQGSRIVITTRDKSTLNQLKVPETQVYCLDELNDTDSLELFCSHAFGKEEPPEQYVNISKEVVSVAGGLPLALVVLGSHLYDKRSIEEWQETLAKLKRIPYGDIHGRLKVSYDGLDPEERKIFLDIACLFIGYHRQHVIDILKECGLSAVLTVKVLNDLLNKSVLKIDQFDKLQMHDQMRDMVRNTVREESISDPGKRSRIWDASEAWKVLDSRTGTAKIEGIVLTGDFTGRRLSVKAFKNMTRLRLLRISGVTLDGDFSKLPESLRWFDWRPLAVED